MEIQGAIDQYNTAKAKLDSLDAIDAALTAALVAKAEADSIRPAATLNYKASLEQLDSFAQAALATA